MRVTKQVIKDKILQQFGWMSYDKHINWNISYDKSNRIYKIHCDRLEKSVNFNVEIRLLKHDIAELFWLSGEIPGIMLKDIMAVANSIIHYSYEERRV